MASLLKYLTVGVINTTLGLSVIYLAMAVLGMGVAAANALGYGLGFGLAFVLNRSWTFADTGAWKASLMRWLAVAGLAFACNLGVAVTAHERAGVDPYLAQLLGVATYTVLTYLGARHFAFRSPGAQPASRG